MTGVGQYKTGSRRARDRTRLMTPEQRDRHERGITLLDAACSGGNVQTQVASQLASELRHGPMKQRLAHLLGFRPPIDWRGGDRAP